jgi:2,4-dienoyl-CoA reductase-like NADH-dependent reductase (Old Yellow Enzyme family)
MCTAPGYHENPMNSLLFSPIKIRDLTLRNRIVVSPMLMYEGVNGFPSDWHLVNLGRFATGGAGLVFLESTKVHARGCTTPRDLGIWKDDFIGPLKRITDFVRAQGARVGIQIGHSGRKARNALPWAGRAPLTTFSGVDHGEEWDLIGPSAIAHSSNSGVPRAMTLQDIEVEINDWGKAASRAHQAGFDILEIHAAHGYLIHQFLSPTANQRTDQYGGLLANRMRFAVEIADEVRRHWPVFMRISAVDGTDWTLLDSIELAKVVKDHGVDVIDCSSGGIARDVFAAPRPGYQVPYAEGIKANSGIRTMAVGLITDPHQAEDILRREQADVVALGREMLYNPNWPIHAAQTLGAKNPYEVMASNYRYWLEKRANIGLAP